LSDRCWLIQPARAPRPGVPAAPVPAGDGLLRHAPIRSSCGDACSNAAADRALAIEPERTTGVWQMPTRGKNSGKSIDRVATSATDVYHNRLMVRDESLRSARNHQA
jgi:hypothetical protein